MDQKNEALRLADALMEEHPFPRDIRLAAAEALVYELHDEVESLRQAYNIVTDDCRNLTEKVIPNIRAQRDALLEALKAMLEQFNYHTITGLVHDESAAIAKARAAIKAAENT